MIQYHIYYSPEALSHLCVQHVIWTPRTLFFDSLDTEKFRSEFAYNYYSEKIVHVVHSYNTNKAVIGIKKQNLKIYRVYIISSVNFVPHFGHPNFYETSVGHSVSKSWLRPCYSQALMSLQGVINQVVSRAAHRKPVADRNRSLDCLMIMITVPK